MEEPFYKDGLHFECQRCSGCCRFDSGYVFLSHQDLDRLASNLSLTQDEFLEKYCVKVDMGGYFRISLIEKPNYDCIFWRDGGCAVYEARPLQCRSYPFWEHQLESKEAWENVAKSCPGINKGALHSRQEIEEWLGRRKMEKLITI
ncbi:MAG: YkgJ family cysteine cluster protein [Spirochaetales bacterium]|nr:YkgJ family cysteine cluster protein [Spirochaetales bacterium]